jgi:outer membrane lipoprotein-sorting protein
LVLALFLSASATAEAKLDPAAEEVESCLKKNFGQSASVQTVSFRAKDDKGSVKETRATVWWKRFPDGFSRVRMTFLDPDDMRGSGYLLLEKEGRNDMFLYLPDLQKSRRITGNHFSGPLFGTDFTSEQLERIYGLAKDSSSKRLPDQTLDGAAVYALESIPDRGGDAASELARVVSLVNKETCVPEKIEFYGKDDKPRWVLTIDRKTVTKEASGFVPHALVMRDQTKGTETELLVEKIELGKDLSDKEFSQAALEKKSR